MEIDNDSRGQSRMAASSFSARRKGQSTGSMKNPALEIKG